MRHIIIAGGPIDIPFAKTILDEESRDCTYIIACDKGFEVCKELGVVPDIVIGDFDSAEHGTLENIKSQGIDVQVLNPVKDDTDTEAALRHAIHNTAQEDSIFILGGTGLRLDHTLGNIALLGLGLKNNRQVILADSHNYVQMIEPGDIYMVDSEPGKFVSVVPYMGKCTGVNMVGFKYPLQDATIEGFDTLTISNEVVGQEGQISIEEGYLVVIESRD